VVVREGQVAGRLAQFARVALVALDGRLAGEGDLVEVAEEGRRQVPAGEEPRQHREAAGGVDDRGRRHAELDDRAGGGGQRVDRALGRIGHLGVLDELRDAVLVGPDGGRGEVLVVEYWQPPSL